MGSLAQLKQVDATEHGDGEDGGEPGTYCMECEHCGETDFKLWCYQGAKLIVCSNPECCGPQVWVHWFEATSELVEG